eukprot:scaffold2478_cov270-Pinguiococcus_pyrenoidosus.AAC.5
MASADRDAMSSMSTITRSSALRPSTKSGSDTYRIASTSPTNELRWPSLQRWLASPARRKMVPLPSAPSRRLKTHLAGGSTSTARRNEGQSPGRTKPPE